MRLSVRTTCLTAIILFSAAFAGCASRPSVNETKETCSISETEKDSTMENVLYGGGMVCNATLFSGEEEEEFSYELPVFSRKEIKEIKVDRYRISGEGDYKITQEETTAGDVYRGWHYYYIHLKVSARPDQPADFSIDSLDLNIDGELYSYTPRSMRFYNPKGLYGQDIPDDGGILLYTDAPEAILSVIPSDPSRPVTIRLEVNEDCTITAFEALDFLDITNITRKVNNSPVPGEGFLSLKKGDEIELSFCLNYKEGFSDSDLIKASRIIRYQDQKGREYLLNEPQGFLIIGFENDSMIRNYIDREIIGDA